MRRTVRTGTRRNFMHSVFLFDYSASTDCRSLKREVQQPVHRIAIRKNGTRGDGPSLGGDANRQNNETDLLSSIKSLRNTEEASDNCASTSISLTSLPHAIKHPVSCPSINKKTRTSK